MQTLTATMIGTLGTSKTAIDPSPAPKSHRLQCVFDPPWSLSGQCRLCELNAIRQVFNVCSSPAVQGAWEAGRELSVHGLAYGVGDGLLKVCSGIAYLPVFLKTESSSQHQFWVPNSFVTQQQDFLLQKTMLNL